MAEQLLTRINQVQALRPREYLRNFPVAEIVYQEFNPEDPDNRAQSYDTPTNPDGSVRDYSGVEGPSGTVYFYNDEDQLERRAVPFEKLELIGERIQDEVLLGTEGGRVPILTTMVDAFESNSEISKEQLLENNTRWLQIIGTQNRWPIMTKRSTYSDHDTTSAHIIVCALAPLEQQKEITATSLIEADLRERGIFHSPLIFGGEDEREQLEYPVPNFTFMLNEYNGISIVDEVTGNSFYVDALALLLGVQSPSEMISLFDDAVDLMSYLYGYVKPGNYVQRINEINRTSWTSNEQVDKLTTCLWRSCRLFQFNANFNYRHEFNTNMPPDVAAQKTGAYLEGVKRIAQKLRGEYTMSKQDLTAQTQNSTVSRVGDHV